LSIALTNKVQKLEAETQALRLSLRAILDRLAALEAEAVVIPSEPKRRGRPPNPVQQ
jgi:hypothetical protein